MTNQPSWNRNRVVRRKEGGEKVRGQWPWEAAQELDLVSAPKPVAGYRRLFPILAPGALPPLRLDLLPGLSFMGGFTVDSRLRRPARSPVGRQHTACCVPWRPWVTCDVKAENFSRPPGSKLSHVFLSTTPPSSVAQPCDREARLRRGRILLRVGS
jgi:hypothetical protein